MMAAAALSGCATAPRQVAKDALFEAREIDIGPQKRRTVLTGFFTGGEIADIAALRLDDGGVPRLQLYRHDGDEWAGAVAAELNRDVRFVDSVKIGGRERLALFSSKRLSWFDPKSQRVRELIAFPTLLPWAARDESGIARVDLTRDLNGDGRMDIVAPTFEGVWIATQNADGSFTAPVKFGPPEPFADEIPLGEGGSYRESGINSRSIPWLLERVHSVDWDLDGRVDLAFWNGDHFDVHLQQADGSFDREPEAYSAAVRFDFDGAYSHAFGYAGEGMGKLLLGFRKKTSRAVLHTFRDLNGDGIADMAIQTLEGKSLLNQRCLLEFHFGKAGSDGLQFAAEPDAVIRPSSRAGGLQASGYAAQLVEDIDGDGDVDVVFRDVNISLGGAVRAMAGNSIALKLEFHCMEDGGFPEKPNDLRRIKPDLKPFGKRGPFFPATVKGDVNGDGREDLIAGHDWHEMRVWLGMAGEALFESDHRTVAVDQPNDERNVWTADLNGDAKRDLVIHHPAKDANGRVILLLAR